jgi:hypothetical protein
VIDDNFRQRLLVNEARWNDSIIEPQNLKDTTIMMLKRLFRSKKTVSNLCKLLNTAYPYVCLLSFFVLLIFWGFEAVRCFILLLLIIAVR